MRLKKQLKKGLIGRRVESVKRTIKFVNLDTAKTAGILWADHDYPAFERLIKVLEQKQITWTDLCFTDDKDMQKAANRISKNDFGLFGKPKSTSILDFTNTEFDLFIDISLSSSVYVQVIRGLSRASFKAGWSDAVPDFFDFRIDVSKRPEPAFLVEQLTHYLSEIKTKEAWHTFLKEQG
ncbi:MAG: hypothetical protein AB2L24_31020 [Mangrovibacterium sp.]